jgi:hypothetical protein
MEKLNLYLNDSQYEKLCILAKEENYETEEEYANEIFYTLLLTKWLKHQSKEAERILNDPTTGWEE